MKKEYQKKLTGMISVFLIGVIAMSGCGRTSSGRENDTAAESRAAQGTEVQSMDVQNMEAQSTEVQGGSPQESGSRGALADSAGSSDELAVIFGDTGAAFTMHLYDNETAAAIAGYVGTSGWRLPVYEYDDEVNYDVMQYYDIPDRYDIPSAPQAVASAKAGEVYYSDPNRVILLYEDAEITGEYTPIGYFDATEEFTAAVRENPVLEGWGNKIIQIAQP